MTWHLKGEPTFSWEPLEALLAERGVVIGDMHSASVPYMLGFHGRSGERRYYRARRRGALGLGEADAIAVYLGLHPSEIWPDWFCAEVSV